MYKKRACFELIEQACLIQNFEIARYDNKINTYIV